MTLVWISRLRVTGGFLADLDVTFSRGLNVVIGPRGAGKTTLLELVRHALGTPHADKSRSEREALRVRSMLGDGEVVLDLEIDDVSHRLVVDAAGGGRRPELAGSALMLGQNELEAIASDAQSRLRLIDLRAQIGGRSKSAESIDALTHQLFAMREEMAELEDRTRQRPLLQADLESLGAEEASLMGRVSADITAKRELLKDLESDLLAVQTNSARAEAAIAGIAALEHSRFSFAAQLAEVSAGPLPPEDAAVVGAALSDLGSAIERVAEPIAKASSTLQTSQIQRTQLELDLRGRAEPLRTELNAAERGLGEITARTRNIRAQLSRLDSDQTRLHDLRIRYIGVHETREQLLDALEAANEQRYRERLAVATEVSQHLSARITVAIEHLADARAFREFLSASLQGSGLKYAAIAEAFSKRLLPRQLLGLIETRDVTTAASATDLPEERVARAIDFLATPQVLAELASIQLEDMANFLLVDGSMLKSVEELSTGQKCAVTLPILLTEHSRGLVLDQPEDHLDNAYLVDNIIVGLNNRSAAHAQTIVATHNANIPVLGAASRVILLNSDGRRGYVSRFGSFDNPGIVQTITTLMEGGEDAFRRRAEFYKAHGLST